MKSVVVGFSSPKKWMLGSEFIKLWQGGAAYSHVYLKLKHEKLGREMIYQASRGSVNCVTAQVFLEKNKVIAEFEYNIEKSRYLELVRYCVDSLGRPYGYLGLIRIVIRKLFKKIKGDGEKTEHCSEFAIRAAPELHDVDPDFCTPKDLYNRLKKSQSVKVLI